MSMTWLLAQLVIFSSILYSVMSECPSCNFSGVNISHIESWTFTVKNGIGTAKCCPRREAYAGSSLLWPNGSNIAADDYPPPDSSGCEEISVALSDQHCGGMGVVCRASWGMPVQKENISTELNPCSTLFSSSDYIDLFQMCLNCTDTTLNRVDTTYSQIIISTNSAGSSAIFSSGATFWVKTQINHAYVPAVAVVAVLVLGFAVAFIIVVVVFAIQHKNRKNDKDEAKQAEEATLLNNSSNSMRSVPNIPANSTSEETAGDLKVPDVHSFVADKIPDHELPCPDSSGPKITVVSQSSPLAPNKRGTPCSQSVTDMASVVLQANNKLYYPQSRSLRKDTDAVIPENDTKRINFSRSLSCPNSSFL